MIELRRLRRRVPAAALQYAAQLVLAQRRELAEGWKRPVMLLSWCWSSPDCSATCRQRFSSTSRCSIPRCRYPSPCSQARCPTPARLSLVDLRDVALRTAVLLDVVMPDPVVLRTDALPAALLVSLGDVRDVVLHSAVLLDVVLLVPVVPLADALLDALLVSHVDARDVVLHRRTVRLRDAGARGGGRRCAARRTARLRRRRDAVLHDVALLDGVMRVPLAPLTDVLLDALAVSLMVLSDVLPDTLRCPRSDTGPRGDLQRRSACGSGPRRAR